MATWLCLLVLLFAFFFTCPVSQEVIQVSDEPDPDGTNAELSVVLVETTSVESHDQGPPFSSLVSGNVEDSLASYLVAKPSISLDTDNDFRSCVEKCEKTGCLNDHCFSSCKIAVNGGSSELLQSKCPYHAWTEWDCTSECRYQCMILREAKRRNDGQPPVKYYGKWPFKRVLGLQEPLSVMFSLANLAVHLQGLISFLYLLHLVLPKRPQGKRGPYYEYSFLWTVYGLASLNSWVWSAVFHARDTLVTEKADYSSAVGLLGIGLIVAIIRTSSLRIEATMVMVAAPVIAFVSTHILYLNFYSFDYGWNMKVCVTIGVLQLLLWTVWAGYVRHPSRLKLWFVVAVGAMSMFLEILDFPPLWGWLDAHALWHAFTVPLTWLWWSFIKEDASHRTFQLLRRTQETGESKKSQ